MAHRPPKKRIPWLAYLWPGLPHLWVEGSWAGLALAIGFTALVNLAIVNLFIWPELMEPRAKWVGGVALAGLWLAALWETRGELKRQAERRRAERAGEPDPAAELEQRQQVEADGRLMAAQRLYLAGDWVETERVLLELIRTNKQDIEAHLLLATVWRHLGRTRHAQRRLRKLGRLEGAGKWQFEIARELELLAAGGEPLAAEPAPPDDSPSSSNSKAA